MPLTRRSLSRWRSDAMPSQPLSAKFGAVHFSAHPSVSTSAWRLRQPTEAVLAALRLDVGRREPVVQFTMPRCAPTGYPAAQSRLEQPPI